MRAILIAILILVFTSCTTTKYVDVPYPVKEISTEYITNIEKDSIFVHDSIDRYISGDTVYQYKYKYIYKYFTKTDTVVKIDTIPVIKKVKSVEYKEVNELKWYQELLMWIGGICSLVGVFLIGRKLK